MALTFDRRLSRCLDHFGEYASSATAFSLLLFGCCPDFRLFLQDARRTRFSSRLWRQRHGQPIFAERGILAISATGTNIPRIEKHLTGYSAV
jgi:hypothetical protein